MSDEAPNNQPAGPAELLPLGRWLQVPAPGPLRLPAGLVCGLLAGRWPSRALHGTIAGVRRSAALWGLGFSLCFGPLVWRALAASPYVHATGEPPIGAAISGLGLVMGWLIGTVCLSPVARLNWSPLVGAAAAAGMLGGLVLAATGLQPGPLWLAALLVLPPLVAWLGLGLGALLLGGRRARRLGSLNLLLAGLAVAGLAGFLALQPPLLLQACGAARAGTPLARGLTALASISLRDPQVRQLAPLYGADPRAFGSAAQAAGRARTAAAVPPLLAALEQESLEVQRAAVEALLEIGSPEALDGLWEAQDELPSSLQSLATRRLEHDRRSAEQLLLASRTAPERQRGELLARLAGSARLSDLPALLRQLHDPDRNARAAACRALGRLQATAAQAALADALKDRDTHVRLAAAEALLALADLRSLPVLLAGYRDISVLCQMYAPALGRMRTPEATRALLQMCAGADEYGIRAVEKALRAQGAVARPVLREFSGHRDAGVRRLVARLLGDSGEAADLAAAQRARSIVDAATWVGRVHGARQRQQPVVPVLLDIVRRGPPDLRPWVREALRTVPPPERVALKAALRDPHPEVCLTALAVLPRDADPTFLLRSPDARLRAAAVRALVDQGYYRRDEALRGLLRSDPQAPVRREAVRGLRFSTLNREALNWALRHDPDVGVRVAAAEALSSIGSPEALLVALRSGDPQVSRAAYRALCRTAGSLPGPGLLADERRRRVLAVRGQLRM